MFAFITTVPVLLVQLIVPSPTANEPVTNLELATIVIVPGLSLLIPLVDWVKTTDPASNVAPLTKVMVPPLFVFVFPVPPTVTAFVTVSLGLPEEAKVSVALVSAELPPICKLPQTALVIFTVTDKLALLDPSAAKVTGSLAAGTPLGFQLLASFQLEVPAPPSQVLDVWALTQSVAKKRKKVPIKINERLKLDIFLLCKRLIALLFMLIFSFYRLRQLV